jgi:hypothetical protein
VSVRQHGTTRTGNQPFMSMGTRTPRFIGCTHVVAVTSLWACSGQVLSFNPATDDNAIDAGPAGAADAQRGADAQGVADAQAALPQGAIDALSSAQALQLCDWLYSVYPSEKGSSVNTTIVPGYANAASFGCAPNMTRALGWPALPPSDCVLNLQSTGCTGTVADLVKCVDAGIAYQSSAASGGSPDCDSWLAACTPFTGAPGCAQTVFQSIWSVNDTPCAGSLPIEAGATCNFADGG